MIHSTYGVAKKVNYGINLCTQHFIVKLTCVYLRILLVKMFNFFLLALYNI